MVPITSVRLVQSLHVTAGCCAVVQVEIEEAPQGVLRILKPDLSLQSELSLEFMVAVIQVSEMGRAPVLVTKLWLISALVSGTLVGGAVETVVLDTGEALASAASCIHLAGEDSLPDDEW